MHDHRDSVKLEECEIYVININKEFTFLTNIWPKILVFHVMRLLGLDWAINLYSILYIRITILFSLPSSLRLKHKFMLIEYAFSG